MCSFYPFCYMVYWVFTYKLFDVDLVNNERTKIYICFSYTTWLAIVGFSSDIL